MWDAPSTYKEQDLKELFSFAKREGINAVYVRIDDYIDIAEMPASEERTRALNSFTASLQRFVRLAHSDDITVYGLAGHPTWADKEHRYISQKIIEYAIDYNASSMPNDRLAGMHFDIKLYNLPSFANEANQTGILSDLILLTDAVALQVKQSDANFAVSFAVPYWLDNTTRVLPAITYKNKTQPAVFHMIDALNQIPRGYIIAMAYRNTLEGTNGTMALVDDEIHYASGTNVHILVAQETKNKEPATITFFGKRRSEVKTAAELIVDFYHASPAFGGIAIHDLEGYRSLQK